MSILHIFFKKKVQLVQVLWKMMIEQLRKIKIELQWIQVSRFYHPKKSIHYKFINNQELHYVLLHL
jgi:hypothetical protein